MTTRSRDMFLDALAPPASTRRRDLEIPGVTAHEVQLPPAPWASKPPTPPPAPPAVTATPAPVTTAPARPDYADDIDRIVRELVAAGDIVWDAALGAYRKQHCRRFRFSDK
jgi:hypothetical protein